MGLTWLSRSEPLVGAYSRNSQRSENSRAVVGRALARCALGGPVESDEPGAVGRPLGCARLVRDGQRADDLHRGDVGPARLAAVERRVSLTSHRSRYRQAERLLHWSTTGWTSG